MFDLQASNGVNSDNGAEIFHLDLAEIEGTLKRS
jgi:hypothetical protein